MAREFADHSISFHTPSYKTDNIEADAELVNRVHDAMIKVDTHQIRIVCAILIGKLIDNLVSTSSNLNLNFKFHFLIMADSSPQKRARVPVPDTIANLSAQMDHFTNIIKQHGNRISRYAVLRDKARLSWNSVSEKFRMASSIQRIKKLLDAPHDKKFCFVIPPSGLDVLCKQDPTKWAPLKTYLDTHFTRAKSTVDKYGVTVEFEVDRNNDNEVTDWWVELDYSLDFRRADMRDRKVARLGLEKYDCHFYALWTREEWDAYFTGPNGFFSLPEIEEIVKEVEPDELRGTGFWEHDVQWDLYIET
jgi:hypothetical protein